MSPRRGANLGRRLRSNEVQPVPPLSERAKPGLSETLTASPRAPNVCQLCGSHSQPGDELARWLEHDEHDRVPQRPLKPVVVVLCRTCSSSIINPHPRLYRQLDNGEPFPGCMGVCMGCLHRSGVACNNASAQINGGPGLTYTWDKPPVAAHLCYGGGRGEFKHLYSGPVRTCSGRVNVE